MSWQPRPRKFKQQSNVKNELRLERASERAEELRLAGRSARLTNVFGIVQGRDVDVASLPGQEASERHQESLVSVNGTDENRHVITLAVFVLRPDFGVVLARVRLWQQQQNTNGRRNWKSITARPPPPPPPVLYYYHTDALQF